MYPGDGLHHAAVAHQQAVAVDVLDATLVGIAETRDRHLLLPAHDAGHRGCPKQLILQVCVHELVQVAEVLQQLLIVVEGRRDQLDQRFGIVGGDVRIGQRRAERMRMRRLRDVAIRPHTQRFALQPPAPARDQTLLAAVHQRRQPTFVHAIDHDTRHHPSVAPATAAHSPVNRPATPPFDAVIQRHRRPFIPACPTSGAAMAGRYARSAINAAMMSDRAHTGVASCRQSPGAADGRGRAAATRKDTRRGIPCADRNH